MSPDFQNPMGRQPMQSAAEIALAGRCPQCNGVNVHAPGFTWWGGALGPKMFNHRVCSGCGFGFDGNTGLSNKNRIVTYVVIVNAICIGLLVLWYMR